MTGPAEPGNPARARPWTPDEAAALDQLRQGHVVDGIPLIALGADGSPVWQSVPAGPGGGPRAVLMEDPSITRKAMIVSQGCDLVRKTFPWATVVPVYDVGPHLNESAQSSARSGQTRYLVPLTAAWAAGGLWVADLRFEIPVDKALLAALPPTDGFADEAGYTEFGSRLAEARQRAAVPEPCLDHVAAPLFEAVRARQREGVNPNDGVRELRVICNDPVKPTTVHLFVIAERGYQPDASEWNRVFDVVHPVAATASISLTGPEIATLDDITATDYLTSAPIADTASS